MVWEGKRKRKMKARVRLDVPESPSVLSTASAVVEGVAAAPVLRLWPGLSEAFIASWGGIVVPRLLPWRPDRLLVVQGATMTSVSNSPGA